MRATLSPSRRALVRPSRAGRAVTRGGARVARVARAKQGDGPKDGDGRAQDVGEREGLDWDGAWRAFKRDFVGDDAKMPSDYVEFKGKNKRYARQCRPIARAIARSSSD